MTAINSVNSNKGICLASWLLLVLVISSLGRAQNNSSFEPWNQFRGPNGSGLANVSDLPTEFGADQNCLWRVEIEEGHSSPVLSTNHVFVTGFEGDSLFVICLDRTNGSQLWRVALPKVHTEKWDYRNNAASPSPVTDGKHLFVFFPEIGLISFDMDGVERWRRELGPFNNVYGMGASPILVDDLVVLVCDQSLGSYIAAWDRVSGEPKWRTERPEAKSGHSTPIIYVSKSGKKQILVPGSFQLSAYNAATGSKEWWVRGLSFEMKSTPVMHENILFINGYGSPLNQPENQIETLPFDETLASHDKNRDGVFSPEEVPDKPISDWFSFVDLAGDGILDEIDWNYYRAALASLNGMLAIRLGGAGDMTDSAILWQYRKSVPQLPSPLLYNNVLYMINDGGVATSLNPANGEVLAQGRLKGAEGQYYASPVAADGKVFMVSREGRISVLDTDGSLIVKTVSDLAEQCYATPAISNGQFFLRTTEALYCFGK